MSNISRALHRIGLDEGRPRGIPGFECAAAVRVGSLQPVTQHPGDLDRFRVRTDDAAACRCGFAQSKQEAVVDIGQTKAGSLAAAVIHKDLESRYAEVSDVGSNTSELRFGRNDKVIAEINSCASFCDGNNVVEYRFEWLRCHEVRNEGGHAALHRSRRLTIGIGRLTRPRNILAVAEMEMNVDGAQWGRMKSIAAEFRRRGRTVVIGGPYASLSPDAVRPHCDVLVRGEIEDIAPQLFADLRSGSWQTEYIGTKVDLRISPLPRWDLYPNDRAVMGTIQTSRGCRSSASSAM